MWHVLERREVRTGFWGGNLKEKGHLDKLGVDGKIVLKWIFKDGWEGGIDWIDLAQNRDRSRGVVSAVMNLRFPKNAGNFLSSWGPVSFSRKFLFVGVSNTEYGYSVSNALKICVIWDNALRRWVCTVQQFEGTQRLHLEDPAVHPLEDTRSIRNVWHSSYVPNERQKDIRRICSSAAAPWESQAPQISVL
jgi:hypothetical protein